MTFIGVMKAVAVVVGLASGVAQASTVGFDVDGPGSSASATSNCMTLCHGGSVSATTVSGLDSTAFSLGVGDSYTFDFIEFTAPKTGIGEYEVSATLAFELPGGSVSNSGDGTFATFFGYIAYGSLVWDASSQVVTLQDGTTYSVSMQGGSTLLTGKSVTTRATVTLLTSPVPLPATGLLLLTAVGGAGALRLKRRTAAAA